MAKVKWIMDSRKMKTPMRCEIREQGSKGAKLSVDGGAVARKYLLIILKFLTSPKSSSKGVPHVESTPTISMIHYPHESIIHLHTYYLASSFES